MCIFIRESTWNQPFNLNIRCNKSVTVVEYIVFCLWRRNHLYQCDSLIWNNRRWQVFVSSWSDIPCSAFSSKEIIRIILFVQDCYRQCIVNTEGEEWPCIIYRISKSWYRMRCIRVIGFLDWTASKPRMHEGYYIYHLQRSMALIIFLINSPGTCQHVHVLILRTNSKSLLVHVIWFKVTKCNSVLPSSVYWRCTGWWALHIATCTTVIPSQCCLCVWNVPIYLCIYAYVPLSCRGE